MDIHVNVQRAIPGHYVRLISMNVLRFHVAMEAHVWITLVLLRVHVLLDLVVSNAKYLTRARPYPVKMEEHAFPPTMWNLYSIVPAYLDFRVITVKPILMIVFPTHVRMEPPVSMVSIHLPVNVPRFFQEHSVQFAIQPIIRRKFYNLVIQAPQHHYLDNG
jgi:hypothetical protein